MTDVKWSILVATLARRTGSLIQVLEDLLPQLEATNGEVEVVAYRNHAERPLGEIRQSLVEEARGQYICFVDDDDRLPEYYVSEVLPLLDGVDYIGWQMQCYLHGQPYPPTFHSLRYDRWWNDDRGYYRDISHLNPVRKDLAADFRVTRGGEDVDWADRMRGRLTTEHYVARLMYHYHQNGDSSWHGNEPRWDGRSDLFDNPSWAGRYRPHFRWHPEST